MQIYENKNIWRDIQVVFVVDNFRNEIFFFLLICVF